MPQQQPPNQYHDPHEWPSRAAIIVSTDVLSALLPAAVSFYKLIAQAQQEEWITFDRWALSEHELIALHIAIDTAARELGVQDDPLYKDIVRR